MLMYSKSISSFLILHPNHSLYSRGIVQKVLSCCQVTKIIFCNHLYYVYGLSFTFKALIHLHFNFAYTTSQGSNFICLLYRTSFPNTKTTFPFCSEMWCPLYCILSSHICMHHSLGSLFASLVIQLNFVCGKVALQYVNIGWMGIPLLSPPFLS